MWRQSWIAWLCSVAVLLAAAPRAASAQQGQRCRLLPEPRAEAAQRTLSESGERVYYISGPARFRCTGGVILQADSAIARPGRSVLELIGDVFYRDSVKTLTADSVDYYGAERRLVAWGHVVLEDLDTHSVIRGPELEYWRPGPNRPVARTVVRGRPHAVFRRLGATSDTAAPDSATAPLEVDADRMTIRGRGSFRAEGRVELVRGAVRGFGDVAIFKRDAQRLFLRGDSARLFGERFRLFGERIRARLAGETLERVTARQDARLVGDELRVEAPTLKVFFRAGAVHRLVAIGAERGSRRTASTDSADAAPTARRARATARDFRLVADSIVALAPGQQLKRITAVGDAYGWRSADSVAVDSLPEIASRDWLRGDTIIGYFGAGQPAADSAAARDAVASAPDSAASGSGRVLERLVAIAGEDDLARSMYRMPDAKTETPGAAINYIIAQRITLLLERGEIQEMKAAGPVRGVHLQPRPSPPDSAASGPPGRTPPVAANTGGR